ncbi:MAG: hypothetical protein F4186_00545, partial [Boseongicola sp. SB0676_bin_33]|nr:hypothetical protein [Boseongicola sp. SB0676_bin_33]
MQRDEVHFAISAALAELGRPAEAVQEAGLIENPITKAEAEAEIVRAAARQGAFDTAFEIAVEIGDARNRSAKDLALETLAVEQAARGLIDGAFDTVVAINNPFRRSEAQAAIAVSVARSGDIPSAMHAAARIGMDYWFTAEQNRFKIASGLVARSDRFDHYWFFEALAEIAKIQSQNGDIDAGLQTAHAIPDLAGRARALAGIAAEQVAQGNIEAALTTARRIEASYGDHEAMVAISDGLAAAGDFGGALEMARAIQETYGDGAALAALAERQAMMGAYDESDATLTDIAEIEDLDRARAIIAREYARIDRSKAALDMVGRIANRNKRFDAVLAIAVTLATEGKTDRALDLVTEFAGRADAEELVTAVV